MSWRCSVRYDDRKPRDAMVGLEECQEPPLSWRRLVIEHRPSAVCWRAVYATKAEALAAIDGKLHMSVKPVEMPDGVVNVTAA